MQVIEAVDDLQKRAKGHANGAYHLWMVLAALRGPDSALAAHKLKRTTTGRIRGILGMEENDQWVVLSQPLTTMELEYRRDGLADLASTEAHFIVHFTLALRSLVALGYDVPEGERL